MRTAPRPQPQVDRDAVRGLLDQLAQAIEQGHLVDADAAAKQIKAALVGNSLHGALERGCNSSWRNWKRCAVGRAGAPDRRASS